MHGKSSPDDREDREYQGVSITSVDVLQQKFRVKFRGYDVQDVDAFLELVAREMERLAAEVMRLRDEAGGLKQSIELYKKKEESINAALLTVQRLADEVKGNASAEAEASLREAKQAADGFAAAARQEADTVRAEAQRGADQLLAEARLKSAEVRSDMLHHKEQAELEARTIVEEARRQALQVREESLREQARLQEDISLLRQQKFQFYISLKSLLENHLKLLDSEERR